MEISVFYSPDGQKIYTWKGIMPSGALLKDVLPLLPWRESIQESVSYGIYGSKATLMTRLFDQDRVELYAPLMVDVKQARKLKVAQARKVKESKR